MIKFKKLPQSLKDQIDKDCGDWFEDIDNDLIFESYMGNSPLECPPGYLVLPGSDYDMRESNISSYVYNLKLMSHGDIFHGGYTYSTWVRDDPAMYGWLAIMMDAEHLYELHCL